MNWKLKAHAMALLSRAPGGTRAYHALQAWLRTDRTSSEEYVRRALEIVALIREGGQDPCRGVYLEIGTGWKPFLPLVLHLIGAERVITLDVNPWLNARYAFATYQTLSGHLDLIAGRLGLDADLLRARYERIAPRDGDLQAFLDSCAVEYRCPADARRTGLADRSIDFVCSSNVLEHVPPESLSAIHAEALRVLRPGGLVVHRFNPQDHYSTVDRSITGANFLRYSERQWRWYGGSGLSYHNRLRCIQHRSLCEAAGFSILVDRVRIDRRAVEELARGVLPVHPDFRGMSIEDLAADYMWLVGASPDAVARPLRATRQGTLGHA